MPTPWPRPWRTGASPDSSIAERAIASRSAAAAAGAHGRERGLLRRAAEIVGAVQVVRQPARRERPRAVGAVAVDEGAGVDDHGLARADDAGAGVMVRERGVRARGDDGVERGAVRSCVVERLLDPPGDVGLGASDERLAGQSLVDRVRHVRGPSNRLELGVVLDGPKPKNDALRGDECRAVGGQRLVAGDGDRVRLEGHRRLCHGAETPAEVAQEVAIDGEDLDPVERPRRFEVAAVREHGDAPTADEHGGVRAVEARQVADVARVRGEEGLGAEGVQLGTQPLDPGVHHRSFR